MNLSIQNEKWLSKKRKVIDLVDEDDSDAEDNKERSVKSEHLSDTEERDERVKNMEHHLHVMMDLMEKLMSEALDCPGRSRTLIESIQKEAKKLGKANESLNEVRRDGYSSYDGDDEETMIEYFRDNKDQKWATMYQQLRDYRIENGNSNVPQKFHENQPLGRWVGTQRENRKIGRLSQDRIDKLDRLYFNWGKNMPDPPSWDGMYQRLVDYQKEHESCNVPFNKTKPSQLAKWMAHQRMEYKLFKKNSAFSLLTPSQIRRLNAISFNWKGPKL